MDILFFINGNLQIIKYGTQFNPKYRYYMRFLTETTETIDNEIPITISIYDNNENICNYHELINGLTLIKLDCTRFIEDYNYQNLNYIKLHYKVLIEDTSDPIFTGEFPIITNLYKDPIKFISLSNNLFDGYKLSYMYELINEKILSGNNLDLILHIGNQIYSSNKKNHSDLYRTLYSNKFLGFLLRKSLNVMMLNKYDIYNNGLVSFLKYQYQLTFDITDDDIYVSDNNVINIKNVLNGIVPIYNHFYIASYKFILLDEIIDKYHNKHLFSQKQLDWLKLTINDFEDSDIVDLYLISAKPIGHISKTNAFLQSIFSNNAKDDLLHPDNYHRTIKLLNIIDNNYGKNISILSGSVNYIYTNFILNNDRIIAHQYINGYGKNIDSKFIKYLDKFQSKIITSLFNIKINNYYISKKRIIKDQEIHFLL